MMLILRVAPCPAVPLPQLCLSMPKTIGSRSTTTALLCTPPPACLQLTHLGGSLGFYSGNVQELLEDVVELKPHIFVSVPRLWNRIYDKVRQRWHWPHLVPRVVLVCSNQAVGSSWCLRHVIYCAQC